MALLGHTYANLRTLRMLGTVRFPVRSACVMSLLPWPAKKSKEHEAERAKLQKRMAADEARLRDLNGAIAGIETLLRVEGATVAAPATAAGTAKVVGLQGSLQIAAPRGGTPPLKVVLTDALADGRPHELEELIAVAKSNGVDFGTKDPHKAVNFTLMGISTGKKVQRVNGNTWQRLS